MVPRLIVVRSDDAHNQSGDPLPQFAQTAYLLRNTDVRQARVIALLCNDSEVGAGRGPEIYSLLSDMKYNGGPLPASAKVCTWH